MRLSEIISVVMCIQDHFEVSILEHIATEDNIRWCVTRTEDTNAYDLGILMDGVFFYVGEFVSCRDAVHFVQMLKKSKITVEAEV